MQTPFEDRVTLKAVEKYMGEEYWDYVINLGDFMDFNCISHFNAGLPGLTLGETLEKDYDHANEILDRHVKLARKKNDSCEIVLLEGNHDYRVVIYGNRFPELGELLSVPRMLGLKRRGVKWVKSWSRGELYKIGHATFHHGRYVNIYHAAKMCRAYGTNIFYGHTHDIQEFSVVLEGADKTIKGKSLGCLCEYDQKYLKGNPTKWQQAITVFYFHEDGFFQEHTIPIFKNRFIGPTNGKVYDGRKL